MAVNYEAYEKHGFQNNQILYAADLIAMEEAIIDTQTEDAAQDTRISTLETAVGSGGSVDSKIDAAIKAIDNNDAAVSGKYISQINIDQSTKKLSVTRAALPSSSVSSVNGQTGDVTIAVPTKLSDLTNDSGFITSAPVTGVKGNSQTTYQTGNVNLTAANVGAATSSHTHGNVQNGGTLQTTDVTIASGDKLVVTDASDSSKVARASVSFDGSTATKALTQKGTWETFNNYTHPTYTSKSSALYKVTVDGTGHVSGTASVAADDIPALPASKITSGTFDKARLPSLHVATRVYLEASQWNTSTLTQTVTTDSNGNSLSGVVTTSNDIIVAPAYISSREPYATAGVWCLGYGNGYVQFSVDTIPTEDIYVNLIIL